jgi:hypothetical protein
MLNLLQQPSWQRQARRTGAADVSSTVSFAERFMRKSIYFTLSCSVLLLLTGCPKPPSPPPPSGQVCGGFRGATCPADQYCSYELAARCGIADAPGICKPRPEICTADYSPVCGCDGRTYSNACVAARAGVSVRHDGQCEGEGRMCGSIAGIPCPNGMICVDIPNDGCDPNINGAECTGTCQPQ